MIISKNGKNKSARFIINIYMKLNRPASILNDFFANCLIRRTNGILRENLDSFFFRTDYHSSESVSNSFPDFDCEGLFQQVDCKKTKVDLKA